MTAKNHLNLKLANVCGDKSSESFVVTWPPSFVQIRKVAPIEAPASPSGDPRNYRCGALNMKVSLPVGYLIAGWLIRPPVVGETVRVLRVSRNGVVTPGLFVSTQVIAIPQHGEFLTANSIYRWSEIAISLQGLASAPQR